MNSYFSVLNPKKEGERQCLKKLHELGISFEIQRIETSFGETDIVITGNRKMPPLVLIHSSAGGDSVAIKGLKKLLLHFSVFIIDAVGPSDERPDLRPDLSDLSYGMWMYEILTRLHITAVTLVGISFGGFVCWKTLLHDSKHIKEAYLIGPAGIVNGNPLQVALKAFWPIHMYKWKKNPVYLKQFVEEIMEEEDESTLEFISKILLHVKMENSAVPNISNEEANNIQTPLYIVAFENDVLFPGRKLLARARQIFPTLQQIRLLKKSPNETEYDSNKEITRMILKNQM